MRTLSVFKDSLDSNMLNVQWTNLRNNQLLVEHSSGRRVTLRTSVGLNNNTIRVNLAALKFQYSLLQGNYRVVAISPSGQQLQSNLFTLEDTSAVITVSLLANLLTVNLTAPSSITSPVKMVLIGEDTGYVVLLELGNGSSPPLMPSTTFDLFLPKYYVPDPILPFPLPNGRYTIHIQYGDGDDVVDPSDPFFYNSSSIWPLDTVLKCGNTVSINIDMFGNDINDINNLTINGSTGTAGQVLTTTGTALAWGNLPVLSPASTDLDMSGKNIINVSQISGSTGSTGPLNIGENGSTNLNGTVYLGRSTLGTNDTSIECSSTDSQNLMDFHCNGDNNIDYDVRVKASGGGTTAGMGKLSIYANSLEITCPISISSTIPGSDTMLGWSVTQTNTAHPVTFNTNTWTVVEPHLISTAGTYLLNWSIQTPVVQSGTLYVIPAIASNIAYGSNAATTTPFVNETNVWAMSPIQFSNINADLCVGSSGSMVIVASANTYYNLCVRFDMISGSSTCATYYQITRIG
jgi:hypothetical protein